MVQNKPAIFRVIFVDYISMIICVFIICVCFHQLHIYSRQKLPQLFTFLTFCLKNGIKSGIDLKENDLCFVEIKTLLGCQVIIVRWHNDEGRGLASQRRGVASQFSTFYLGNFWLQVTQLKIATLY